MSRTFRTIRAAILGSVALSALAATPAKADECILEANDDAKQSPDGDGFAEGDNELTAIACGGQATATDSDNDIQTLSFASAFGFQASVYATGGTAIGALASVGEFADYSVALGYSAEVTAPYSVAIGTEAQVDNIYAVAIGYEAYTAGIWSVALGNAARGELCCRYTNRMSEPLPPKSWSSPA